ncbi:hypothetical protein BRAS3843_3330009 [Bradyrhizobium sp. STM 3843]|nr:hypothetical protein BRAS3843_3330009 [Bradyrhizobium sp. STM 3843]
MHALVRDDSNDLVDSFEDNTTIIEIRETSGLAPRRSTPE